MRLVEIYDYARDLLTRAMARLFGAGRREVALGLRGALTEVGQELLHASFRQARSYDYGRQVERRVEHHLALRLPQTAHKLALLLPSDPDEAAVTRALHRTHMIADTEVSNLNTITTVGAYVNAGATTFAIIPVLDQVTTATCHAAAGLVLDVRRAAHRRICPACHFCCRSYLVPSRDVPSLDADVARVLAIRAREFPTWKPRLTHLLGGSL